MWLFLGGSSVLYLYSKHVSKIFGLLWPLVYSMIWSKMCMRSASRRSQRLLAMFIRSFRIHRENFHFALLKNLARYWLASSSPPSPTMYTWELSQKFLRCFSYGQMQQKEAELQQLKLFSLRQRLLKFKCVFFVFFGELLKWKTGQERHFQARQFEFSINFD